MCTLNCQSSYPVLGVPSVLGLAACLKATLG